MSRQGLTRYPDCITTFHQSSPAIRSILGGFPPKKKNNLLEREKSVPWCHSNSLRIWIYHDISQINHDQSRSFVSLIHQWILHFPWAFSTFDALDHWQHLFHQLSTCGSWMQNSQWPLFLKVTPPQNKAFSNQNKGHLGARYMYILVVGGSYQLNDPHLTNMTFNSKPFSKKWDAMGCS